MKRCKNHLNARFAVCALVGVLFFVSLANPTPEAAGVDSRGTAFGKKVKGDLGERMMDDFYTSSGHEKIDCSVGVNGADGVYVKRNADGTIVDVIVSECKTDTAQLGRLDGGTGPYQGSQEYYLRKINEKIQALEKGPRTPEVERLIEDLKQIRRKMVYGDYRSRLFKMDIVDHNGKICIKLQTSELVFENGPNAKPTVKPSRGRPVMIDMTTPDSELSPYKCARRKQYYANLKDELIERTKKGGYGISKPLTEEEAQKIVDELKEAFEAGKIKKPKDLIEEVAKKCGIGVDEAAEVVEKSIGAEVPAKGPTARASTSATKAQVEKANTRMADGIERDAKSSRRMRIKDAGSEMADDSVKTARKTSGRGAVADSIDDAAKASRRAAERNTKQLRSMEATFRQGRNGIKETKVGVGMVKSVKTPSGAVRTAIVVPASSLPKTALKVAAAEGCVAFVFSEGMAAVTYFAGGMSETEFYEATAKNVSSSLVSAGAVYAAVMIGASPGGPVVMAVAIGSYVIADITFDVVAKAVRPASFEMDDILGFTSDFLDGANGVLNPETAPSILDPEKEPSILAPETGHGILNPEVGNSLLDGF